MRGTVRFCCLVLFALVVVPAGTASAADEPDWKAGFGRADITPETPVWMYGYAGRDHPSEGVRHPIHVKALVLEDSEGARGVIVTMDVGDVKPFFIDAVHALVSKELELPRERFLFTVAHNHSGPLILQDASSYSGIPEDQLGPTVAYAREVERKVARAILDAAADLQPARLSWGVGVAPFVMNRREHTPRGIILGANPRGPADRSVPVLRIEGEEGALRGVLFACACHNTALRQRNYLISGDYAGYAQTYIEDRNPDACAMFMTGCGADADPYPRGDTPQAGAHDAWYYTEQHGRTLGVEVCRVLESELDPVRSPLRIATGTAQLPFEQQPDREQLELLANGRSATAAASAQSLLDLLDSGKPLPTHQDAPLSVWQFGEDLTMVMLSGEVVSEYVPLVEDALGPRRLWLGAYAHHVFGYVTTARIQREGGYEAKGIRGKGVFAEETQDVYVAKIRELAEEVGRPDLPPE